MNKNIELIAMIYKSPTYLKFIVNELLECEAKDWDVHIRIVANDANEQVLECFDTLNVPYSIYKDRKPNDYYLNRVYRCWNYAGFTSRFDNICFINSDMAFSKDWLINLLNNHDGVNVPCSRLVESGKLRSGKYGIEKNFGTTPSTYDRKSFTEYADTIKTNEVYPGGLFMPCVFNTQTFIESGGYPEGNIYYNPYTSELISGDNTLPFYMSGDQWFFNFLSKKGLKHTTVFNSIVYHMQEGEKDE